MKHGKKRVFIVVFIIVLCFLTLYGCNPFEQNVSWNDAEEVILKNALSGYSSAELLDSLGRLDGVRSVRFAGTPAYGHYETEIIARLTSYGLTVSTEPVSAELTVLDYHATPETKTFVMDNIIAKKPGTKPELAPVYVTAHWDSVENGPGMDDNASGCAALIEAARLLQGVTLERTVCFVIFSFEEDGLLGSEYHAGRLSVLPAVVINMDAVAYTSDTQTPMEPFGISNVGDFIAVFAMSPWQWLGLDFCAAADRFSPELKYKLFVSDAGTLNNPLLLNTMRSDHASFLKRSVPSLFFTDMANFRNTNYHTANDTIDTLNLVFLKNVTLAITALCALEAGIIE